MLSHVLRSVVFALAIAFSLAPAPSLAQTPPGWSKQDVDKFVDAVSEAVARKLAEQGKSAPAGATAAGSAEEATEVVERILARARVILANVPGIFQHMSTLPKRLDRSGAGGHGFPAFLGLLALIAGVGLVAEWAVRLATSRFVSRLVEGPPPPSWPRWLALAAIEALALVALWAVGHGAYAALFATAGEQSRIAGLLLMSLFWWRLGLSVLRCWLRPNLPGARLAPISDQDAASIMRGVAIATGVSSVSRALAGVVVATGAAKDVIVAQQFLNAPIVIGCYVAVVLSLREPMARWLEALMSLRSRENWDGFLARNWHFGGVAFYIGLWGTVMYGGITGRTDLPMAVNDLQLLVVAWLLVETALYCTHKRRMLRRQAAEITAPQIEDIAWRSLDILVRIALAIMMIRVVATEVLNLIPQSAWAGYAAQLAGVGIVMFAAWVIWQALKLYFARVAGPERGPVLPGEEDMEQREEAIEGSSRLRTLVPVLKNVVGVAIFALTALIVLSQLGINITPVLAGASIFGLAISFGSQALVRDIVSGVFFLADDAFRVGEYIDIGKAKGTVESFTLRSIRLRHQSGQIHTIPFGQLGQITNFSRDYATVKFNLRFARDTDVEALRKAAKKIGQELMEQPDIKDDFLLPLKMQGIADIQDNALIARFKFTVKPGRPSYIQRLAVKRMLQTFPEKGIEFASATVAVKSLDGGPVPAEAAAAAARSGAPAEPAPVT